MILPQDAQETIDSLGWRDKSSDAEEKHPTNRKEPKRIGKTDQIVQVTV